MEHGGKRKIGEVISGNEMVYNIFRDQHIKAFNWQFHICKHRQQQLWISFHFISPGIIVSIISEELYKLASNKACDSTITMTFSSSLYIIC